MSDWTESREDMLAQARRLDGLYAGMCNPQEYEHLIAAGLLRKVYDHPGGFLGLAKLELVKSPTPSRAEGERG